MGPPQLPALSPIMLAELRDRLRPLLRAAYQQRAAGQTDLAAKAFVAIVNELRRAGESPRVGAVVTSGDIVISAGVAGWSRRGNGTLFFEVASGQPIAFAPDFVLPEERVPLKGGYFATSAGGVISTLYRISPTGAATRLDNVIAIEPAGSRAYTLEEDCRPRQWQLDKDGSVRVMDAYPRPLEHRAAFPCTPEAFGKAAVSADGRFLVSAWGRWDVRTAKRLPLPFNWLPMTDAQPAVDDTGRYVARLMVNRSAANPHAENALWLMVYDLTTGAVLRRPRGMIVNPNALSILSDPLRVCVRDYSNQAYRIPSLEPLSPPETLTQPGGSCDMAAKPARKPAPDHLDVRARLAAHICTLSGLPIPIAFCDP